MTDNASAEATVAPVQNFDPGLRFRINCSFISLPGELTDFLKGETKELPVPGSSRTVKFDGLQRVGVGISRLGTSEATAIGAYAFALRQLEKRPASLVHS
jgi:hypothetical protein